MRPIARLAVACAFAPLFMPVASATDIQITGRVVDAKGAPVVNATVSSSWRANGSSTKPDGTPFDLQNEKELVEFWGHIGDMQPWQNGKVVRTADDGTFTVPVNSRSRIVFAMDSARVRGGFGEIPAQYHGQAIAIQLRRLPTVQIRIRSAVEGKSIQWSHLYVELPHDPTRPLASNRVLSCGSFDGRFQFRLPEGRYRLDAYATSRPDGNIDLYVNPPPEITIEGRTNEVTLGPFDLTLAPPDRSDLESQAKAQGRWHDYTEHFGEPAPDWNITDVRGLPRAATVTDFRGKWLLINFWGLSCTHCLQTGLPRTVQFYERHASLKDRFAVVGVCIDFDGDIKNIQGLDEALAPIQEHVWNGKQIPFPIILDSTFRTWERFGIPGLGTVVLIDPSGNLVEGNETTLNAILHGTMSREDKH